jgi:hypothetical protein
MNNWLKCNISLGQFSDEYAVSGVLFDNSTFSLFADKEDLKFEREPTQDESTEGWIKIFSGERQNDLVLVTLPKPTLGNGRFITVTASQMETVAV